MNTSSTYIVFKKTARIYKKRADDVYVQTFISKSKTKSTSQKHEAKLMSIQ